MNFNEAKGLIDDIRSTPNSFISRYGCLELFDLIEAQQEKIESLNNFTCQIEHENMISKEKYVLNRVERLAKHYESKDECINPLVLSNLIDQWSFDYDIEKEYRPEILREEKMI